MSENKKFVIDRYTVKKVLGFVGSAGVSYVMGSIVGTFGPRNKLGQLACVLGAWSLGIQATPIIEDGISDGVDSICDLIDLVKEKVVIKKDPDLKIVEDED